MPTHHISRFLHRNNRLHPILIRIDRDRRILDAIRDSLPGDLRNHCIHVAVQDDNELVIHTTSPVWATRLRFVAPDLVRAIPELSPSMRVTVRIASTPYRQHIRSPGQTGPRLSPGARLHLLEAAEDLMDENLAAALRRLARGRP